MNKCCYGCKQRTSICHDSCDLYLAEKEELAKKKAWLKQKSFYAMSNDFQKKLERKIGQ